MMPVLKLLSKEKGVIEEIVCEYRYSLLTWLGTEAGNQDEAYYAAVPILAPHRERRVCFKHLQYAFERANSSLKSMMR